MFTEYVEKKQVDNTVDAMQATLEKHPVVVVKYGADWCGPCHTVDPVLTKLSNQYSTVPMIKINIDHFPEIAEWARIKAIPMVIMYKDGHPQEFIAGAQSFESYDEKLRRLIHVSDIK